jgi:methylglyoxal synthase
MPKTLALIAHDAKKAAMAEWVARYAARLQPHTLVCTATTGKTIREQVPAFAACTDSSNNMVLVKSGPLGGDQQVGAMIAEGKIDALIFFPDPLTPMPHDVDVKALLRLALVYDVPCALNVATATAMMDSGFLKGSGSILALKGSVKH